MISNIYDLPLIPASNISSNEDNLIRNIEYIQFALFLITIPFYIFILYFINQARLRKIEQLATPFFTLCLTTGLIDILNYLNNYVNSMFPKWAWGVGVFLYFDSYYAHVYFYIAWFTGLCQVFSVAVVATNRLTAIIFPYRTNKLWSSRNLKIAICVQFIPSALLTSATLFQDTQLYRNKNNGISPKFVNQNTTTIFFKFCGVLLLVVCIYLITGYVYLFLVLRRSALQPNSNSFRKLNIKTKRRDIKLLCMSSIVVVIQFLAFTFLVIASIPRFVTLNLEEFYLVYNLVSDIYAGCNPYLLWIFSDSLRNYIFEELGWNSTKFILKRKKGGAVSKTSANVHSIMIHPV